MTLFRKQTECGCLSSYPRFKSSQHKIPSLSIVVHTINSFYSEASRTWASFKDSAPLQSLEQPLRGKKWLFMSLTSLTPVFGFERKPHLKEMHVHSCVHVHARTRTHTHMHGIQTCALFSSGLIKTILFIAWVCFLSFNTSAFRL